MPMSCCPRGPHTVGLRSLPLLPRRRLRTLAGCRCLHSWRPLLPWRRELSLCPRLWERRPPWYPPPRHPGLLRQFARFCTSRRSLPVARCQCQAILATQWKPAPASSRVSTTQGPLWGGDRDSNAPNALGLQLFKSSRPNGAAASGLPTGLSQRPGS